MSAAPGQRSVAEGDADEELDQVVPTILLEEDKLVAAELDVELLERLVMAELERSLDMDGDVTLVVAIVLLVKLPG